MRRSTDATGSRTIDSLGPSSAGDSNREKERRLAVSSSLFRGQRHGSGADLSNVQPRNCDSVASNPLRSNVLHSHTTSTSQPSALRHRRVSSIPFHVLLELLAPIVSARLRSCHPDAALMPVPEASMHEESPFAGVEMSDQACPAGAAGEGESGSRASAQPGERPAPGW